jgi:hypothetical protein
MAKNDNPQLLRMVESLNTVIGNHEGHEFEKNYPLSKSANINKKFEWAKEACEYLEKNYDRDTNMRIREKCICNDGKATVNTLLKYLKETDSISEFVDRFNEKESFASLEYIHNSKLMFCYPECYCSCVKRVKEQLPETWCFCTLGYAKKVFSKVFGKEVKAELVESIKMGNQRCAVSIEW